MNNLFLWSEDVDAGNIYDGQWNLTSEITGQWELSYLNFDGPTTFPWMWTGVNSLRVRMYLANYVDVNQSTADATQDNHAAFTVNFLSTMFNETDKNVVASEMSNNILAAMVAQGGNLATIATNHPALIVVVYNGVNNIFNLQVDFPNNIFADWVIYRMQIFWSQSSCRDIFGKTTDEDTGDLKLVAPIVYNFNLLSTNVVTTPPKFLQCFIDQSIEYIVRSKDGTYPNLIIPTEDIPLNGQEIHLLTPTNILNISFFSPLTTIAPIPFTGSFIMYFQLKSLD